MACDGQNVWHPVLLCVVMCATLTLGLGEDEVIKVPLMMPNIKVESDELYVCTPLKMDPGQKKYIVGFEPNATAARVHHVIVYGCKTPGTKLPFWNCGHQKNTIGLEKGSICGSGNQVVYVWARDAPELILPDEVGFEVGGDSPIEYLVLQVHYAHKLPDNVRDSSGVILHFTNREVKRQASVLTLTAGGSVPPHSVSYWEAGCRIDENKTMHPFAYRVHTHLLGASVAGYRVRRDSNGTDVWTLLGRRDPQLPQMFNPVNDFGTIGIGDQLASQCTMKNFRGRTVWQGRLFQEEMCMFYLMYWVEGDSPLTRKYCTTKGPPSYTWANSNNFNNIPVADTKPL